VHDSTISFNRSLGDLIVVLEVDDDDFRAAGALRAFLPYANIVV